MARTSSNRLSPTFRRPLSSAVGTVAFLLLGVLGVLVVGCSGTADGDRHAGGKAISGDAIASRSGPIALGPDERTLWVVNPDADTVTAIDTNSYAVTRSLPVGDEPWSVAVTPEGLVITVNRADGTLTFLAGDERRDLRVGSEPAAIALSPSGRIAYVTVTGSNEVAVVDTRTRQVLERVAVSAIPWAVAVSNDGDDEDHDETIVVTHRLALPLGGATRQGQVTLLRIGPGAEVQAGRQVDAQARSQAESPAESQAGLAAGEQHLVPLPAFDFGFANALEGVALQGGNVFVVHLLDSPGLPRQFNTTVSSGVSVLSLADGAVVPARSVHLNDPTFSTPVSFPRSVGVTRDGARAYVVLAGSDAVMGIDLTHPEAPKLIGFWAVGKNPRGIVLDSSEQRAFVMNYLSRDVSVLDLTDTTNRPTIERIRVTPETLPAPVIEGKILFHNANDPRVSRLGWMSCASCHLDGGGDGTAWDTPEGVRNTMPLWNLAGTAPFHASATRDELQDFELDIESLMKGVGLAPDAAAPLLQEPNAGRSEALDVLAAFLLEGFRVPAAPDADAELVRVGRNVFEAAGCAACHGGDAWTASHLPGPPGTLAPAGEQEVTVALHDVGTHDPERDVLGEHGFDVPTLLGLSATAPYLHDGSAPTLGAVLRNERHMGGVFTAHEEAGLIAFLNSIDSATTPFPR